MSRQERMYKKIKEFTANESGCKLLSSGYVDSKSKLLFQCKCGNEFEATFSKFKHRNKRQCNECSGCAKWNIKRVRNFIEHKSESGCKLISEEYVNSRSYLDIQCRCGNIFNIQWRSFLYKNSRTCPSCIVNPSLKTHLDFVKDVEDACGNEYKVLGEYIGAHTHLKMKHNVCGREWLVTPANFLNTKTRCPICNGGIKKSQDRFVLDVRKIYGDEYKVIGEYINYNSRVSIRHETCGNVYRAVPSVLLKGIGCHLCSESKGETRVREILELYGVEYRKEESFDGLRGVGGNLLRFDFYLPDYNILVEYDGEFHFKKYFEDQNFQEIQIHDKRKNQYCLDNNIPLIRIPYWQLDKIEEILDKWLRKYKITKPEHNKNIKL